MASKEYIDSFSVQLERGFSPQN